MTYDRFCKDILEKGYTLVPFLIPRQELDQAARHFLDFLSLPEEFKNKIFYHINPNNRGTRTGYTRQERSKGDTDQREYFHYNEHFEDYFKDSPYLEHPVLAQFLASAGKVYKESKATAQKILKEFDTEFPGLYETFFSDSCAPFLFLRFLKYDAIRPGEFLAKGHYDRGDCTLAIAESAPGLRIGKNEFTVKEVKHEEHSVLFFPGLTFNELTSSDFHPSWHDVVQKSEHSYSRTVVRWAIVLFIDHLHLRNISYDEAHTPKTHQ